MVDIHTSTRALGACNTLWHSDNCVLGRAVSLTSTVVSIHALQGDSHLCLSLWVRDHSFLFCHQGPRANPSIYRCILIFNILCSDSLLIHERWYLYSYLDRCEFIVWAGPWVFNSTIYIYLHMHLVREVSLSFSFISAQRSDSSFFLSLIFYEIKWNAPIMPKWQFHLSWIALFYIIGTFIIYNRLLYVY